MARLATHRPPRWLETAVFYQIYPQSFCDSDGDGIGDLPGIVSKLDYLRSLGVTALWLNPVFVSPFGDAGYDIADFRRVAPRYGTNRDLERLFRAAHRRGMKVCLDLVAGHTSVEHPWFRASARAERNRHSDWYHWTPTVWDHEPGTIRGYGGRDGGYLPNFFWFQPALNYGYARPDPKKPWQLPVTHPAVREVREELRGIMKFWLDRGADGFRVDMASSLVRGDPDGKGLRALWRDYRAWLDVHYPEAVLIAEWCHPRRTISAGFDVDFLIHFGEPAYNAYLGTWDRPADGRPSSGPPAFFEREGKGDIRRFLDNYLHHYRAVRGRGYISMPTGNHDFPRHRRGPGREERDLRVILAALLTMPGVPFLYYGDEIGMRYREGLPAKEGSYTHRTGSRTPMQWTGGRNAGFSAAPPSRLYLPVDPAPDAPSVAAQEADPGSLLHLVRRLLALRRDFPALGNTGSFRPVYAERKKYPFVYERRAGRDRFWIALNPAARPVRVALPPLASVEAVDALDASLTAGKRKSALAMRPVSYGVFRVR